MPCPTAPKQGSRAGAKVVARVSQWSRSSDRFVGMKQVRGQARKSICRSVSGQVRVLRVRHYPVITKRVYNDEEGLMSGQEVSLWVSIQVNGVHSPVQAELETHTPTT